MNKNELDVKYCSKIAPTVENTCFVNIPEDEIKLENTEIPGKLIVHFNKKTVAQLLSLKGGGRGGKNFLNTFFICEFVHPMVVNEDHQLNRWIFSNLFRFKSKIPFFCIIIYMQDFNHKVIRSLAVSD